MSTELELRRGSSDLALSGEQHFWNDKQVAALRHIGVEDAGSGDLEVFFHVCQRTGLDPFARQIHMIGRNAFDQKSNQWTVKQTIQTGIDGFRLIGRRAATRSGHKVSLSAPEWAHEDGSWRTVWIKKWGDPIAARVTISRDGEPFAAVALFDEYKQTKRNGELTSMWTQRPAGQLAKCAEALAWRMAFPQDLSGIYTDEEMAQADSRPAERDGGLGAALNPPADNTQPDAATDAHPPLPPITAPQLKKLHTMLSKVGLGGDEKRDDALVYYARVTGTVVETSKDLTKDEAKLIIDDLENAEKGDPSVFAEWAGEPEPGPPLVTAAQVIQIGVCLTNLGVKDRAKGLRMVADYAGRETVESTKHLTKAEAVRVLDGLEAAIEARDAS